MKRAPLLWMLLLAAAMPAHAELRPSISDRHTAMRIGSWSLSQQAFALLESVARMRKPEASAATIAAAAIEDHVIGERARAAVGDDALFDNRFVALTPEASAEASLYASLEGAWGAGLAAALGPDGGKRFIVDRRPLQSAELERLRAQVSDEDIRRWYDSHPEKFKRTLRVRARHVRCADEETCMAARAALARGMPFAQAARRWSVAPDAAQGGDMGWLTATRARDDWLVQLAFAQPVGPPTEPLHELPPRPRPAAGRSSRFSSANKAATQLAARLCDSRPARPSPMNARSRTSARCASVCWTMPTSSAIRDCSASARPSWARRGCDDTRLHRRRRVAGGGGAHRHGLAERSGRTHIGSERHGASCKNPCGVCGSPRLHAACGVGHSGLRDRASETRHYSNRRHGPASPGDRPAGLRTLAGATMGDRRSRALQGAREAARAGDERALHSSGRCAPAAPAGRARGHEGATSRPADIKRAEDKIRHLQAIRDALVRG